MTQLFRIDLSNITWLALVMSIFCFGSLFSFYIFIICCKINDMERVSHILNVVWTTSDFCNLKGLLKMAKNPCHVSWIPKNSIINFINVWSRRILAVYNYAFPIQLFLWLKHVLFFTSVNVFFDFYFNIQIKILSSGSLSWISLPNRKIDQNVCWVQFRELFSSVNLYLLA